MGVKSDDVVEKGGQFIVVRARVHGATFFSADGEKSGELRWVARVLTGSCGCFCCWF